jgi:hypothetical protein
MFALYDCEVSIKISDQFYTFEHVDSVSFEDPKETKLTRGADGRNKQGLIYTQGHKDPEVVTLVLPGVSKSILDVLVSAHSAKSRVEVACIAADGSAKTAKNGVIRQRPQQLTIDESAESLNVQLIVESFDVSEVIKE